MQVQGCRAGRLRLLIDILRRMKLIQVVAVREEKDSPIDGLSQGDKYMQLASELKLEDKLFKFGKYEDVKSFWNHLASKMKIFLPKKIVGERSSLFWMKP
eukprot:UN12247